MPRGRRATIKAIDYSKEQQFSDDDVFEDGAEDSAPAPIVRRRARQTEAPAVDFGGAMIDDPDAPDPKTRYFEKGYDPNLPHIRDRFTFMPELEPDGSPKVELIVGRRLINAANEDENDSGPDESDADNAQVSKVDKHNAEHEYLIKYKGVSYLHLEWKTASDLESMNKSAKNLYRRFIKKLKAGQDEDLEDPEFDPSYIQPQRIIDEDEHEIIVELDDAELAQWEKENENDAEDSDEEEESVEEKKNGSAPNGALAAGLEDDKSSGKKHDSIVQYVISLKVFQVHI